MPPSLFLALVCASVLLAVSAQEEGRVQELSEETFASLTGSGRWFVKFYAPWCQHCQKMAPAWEELALHLHETKSDVEVAKLDCTAAKPLCQSLSLRGFPTLMYIHGDVRVTFRGTRTLDAFQQFLATATQPAAATLATSEELQQKKSEVSALFTLVVPDLVLEDPLRPAFLVAAQRLVLDASSAVTTAAVAGLERGAYLFRDGSTLKYDGEVTADALTAWMKQEKYPSFFELTREAGADISENANNTLVAILLLDVSKDNAAHMNVMRTVSLAKQSAWNFPITWMSAAEGTWQPFVERNFHLYASDLPRLTLFNIRTLHYYLLDQATPITEQSVAAFFEDALQGKIEARGGQGFFTEARNLLAWVVSFVTNAFYHAYQEYPALMQLSAASVVFFMVVMVKSCLRAPAAKSDKKD